MEGQIEITISAEGDTKIVVKGVSGPGCQDLTAGIEKALGVVTSNTKNREFAQEVEHRKTTRN